MLLLSLMSQHKSAQDARGRQASLFDVAGVPEFREGLPENSAPMGDALSGVMPAGSDFLPAVDVAQIVGSIE